MSISLDGVELNSELNWENRFKTSQLVQSSRRFLAGNLYTLQAQLIRGTSIILVALNDQGWFTKTQMDAMIVRANVLGAIYELNYAGDVHLVMFDSSDGDPYEFDPLVHQPVYTAENYFTGTLKFLTV